MSGIARACCSLAGVAAGVAIALVLAMSPALAAKRLALIVGNDLYQNVPTLRRAVTDANAVASDLRRLGFVVAVAENQSRRAMSEAFAAFDTRIAKGDTVFFFFSGHGFEISGRNYLLPIDVPAAVEGEAELIEDASFAVEGIIDRFQARGAQTAILVLDACRNNPFARPGQRGIGNGGGLAAMTPPEGIFVLFSAGAKQTALDSLGDTDTDPDSVFTRAFVRELATPNETLVQIAKRTQSEVKGLAATVSHEQTPAYYDQIVGDFVIDPKAGGADAGPVLAAITPPRPQTLAPQPAPPRLAPNMVINAPIAIFMRHNGGWSVSLSFVDPVTAIAWRLGDSGPFHETGFLNAFDTRTRRRMANPGFELDADAPAATLEVKAVDVDGHTAGPFPIRFDPTAELIRGDRQIIEMTAGSWLSFREFDGLLVYYTQLMSYRCAIRELRIGIDSDMPTRTIALPPCNPKDPNAIPAGATPYLKLPPATKLVSVELTYRDGSVSEIKTFRR